MLTVPLFGMLALADLASCPEPPQGWNNEVDIAFLADIDYRLCNYRLDGTALYAAMNDGFGDCTVHPSFAEGSDWAMSSGLTFIDGIAQSAFYRPSAQSAVAAPVGQNEGCDLLISTTVQE